MQAVRKKWRKRVCPKCNETFKAMSDAMWRNALSIHLLTDKKHGLSAGQSR
jgi:hypothetical protein